jgi:uncharacterized membrane protein/uncharacterized membrane protein YidH (DUF202 family)
MRLRLLTEFQDVPLKVVLPVLLVAFAAALVFALWTYRRARRVLRPGWYYTLILLRCVAVLVLFLCVLKPVLVTPEEAPRRGRVAVFLDNTGSMARTKDSLGGLDAAVVVSDGVHTAGEEGPLLARALSVPTHCVGVGEKGSAAGAAPDVAVTEIVAKRTMFARTRTTINFTVAKRNVPRGEVRVVATDGRNAIGEKTVELSGAEGTERFSMEVTPRETGPRRFTLTATKLADEKIVANNSRYFSAAVKDPDLKVLYFEGRPRWEFKYLRRTMEETPNLRLISVVRTATESFYVQGGDSDLDFSAGLPKKLKTLNDFNVIILGAGGTEILSTADIANLAAYVEGGKGLIVLGTEDLASFKNTPLEKVLPLHIEKGRNPERFQLSVTPEGARHAILAGVAEKLDDDPALRTLQGRVLTGRQRGGATVLATDGTEPVLAVQNYGKGHCLLITADNTWRWYLHLQQRGYESLYATFWLQAVRWAAEIEPGEKAKAFPIAAWTDKDYYDPGDEIEVTLETEEAIDKVAAVLKRGGEDVGPLQWRARDDRPNTYTATLQPADVDEYEIAVRYGAEDRSLHFAVGDPLLELTDTGLNENLLKAIALRSGGRYFDLTQGSDLVEALKRPTRQPLAARAEIGIWDTPWPFLVFVLLCSAEWFIRRWKQLT